MGDTVFGRDTGNYQCSGFHHTPDCDLSILRDPAADNTYEYLALIVAIGAGLFFGVMAVVLVREVLPKLRYDWGGWDYRQLGFEIVWRAAIMPIYIFLGTLAFIVFFAVVPNSMWLWSPLIVLGGIVLGIVTYFRQ